MDPEELLAKVATLLWGLADGAVASLANALDLPVLAGETDPALSGKLLEALANLPDQHSLLKLVHDLVGNLSDAASPLRAHGWKRSDGTRGLAFVLTKNGSRGVLAVSPGPVIDLVVTPNAVLDHSVVGAEWDLTVSVRTDNAWTATFTPGGAAAAPAGTVAVTVGKKALAVGAGGLGISTQRVAATLAASPATPAHVDISVEKFTARLLPASLAGLLGGSGAETSPTDLTLAMSRTEGLRFTEGRVRVERRINLQLPGISVRTFAVALAMVDGKFVLQPSVSVLAKPPALPMSASLDEVGIDIPILLPDRIGIGTDLVADLPSGMGIDLLLGPVSGGGFFKRRGADAYAGGLDINLGVLHVTAFGLLQLPGNNNNAPLSLLVLLGAEFPYPGIQLGFGFAIDAVGGLVGINRRADTDHLHRLVSEGNADRILFPGNAIARADEIVGALESCFPVAPGRFVVGPMVRITWGGRMVSLAVAVILELPDPGRMLMLGRLLIALPDPAVPLIRLQASVSGQIVPAVPLVDSLVSLAGSWIVGIPVTGEIYLLFRGGGDAVFVVSAGGFHPKYTRPPGVPQLTRLTMDLGGGVIGLRAESYLALTSNSLQFGAQLHLDATVAECGLEGGLGLDALFVWEPTLAFQASVHASVAVLAFGERLAGIGLDFTLEGPSPWHAYGKGSIEVLFWEVSLDFDVRWGDPAPLTQSTDDIFDHVAKAVRQRDAWAVERPAAQRAGIKFTETAKKELAQGIVAQPDASLRVSQSVVPLDIAINRFHRLGVPEQTWQITSGHLDAGLELPRTIPVPEQFVPGEYFAMTKDEQLGRGAFEQRTGGYALSNTAVEPGPAHVMDDRYETGYKVEQGWFPAPPNPRIILRLRGNFLAETFARTITAAERVDRWRLAQRPFEKLVPKVVINR
ncbi:DUF6603 domain-containing protein [Nocardia sp. NBC_01009]|uniref:DUF6603 domain-containing protein n=1 Tax=Nocardia sp. NBC_01009 TaxID=2975996 RepID=UPI0038658F67|nr:hypothetical protein OHA42_19995 [Nocardia sp. NBC_01009]